MSQLVQSACPGCKKVLRIPAEWMLQAMRCKHCGLVMQARPSSARAAAPASPTPLPATKKPGATPPVARIVPAGQVAPRAPLAVPVAAPAAGSAFADLTPDEEEAPRTGRRRRRRGSWWKAPLFFFVLLLAGGAAVYFGWDRLAALIPPDDEPVARNDRGKDPVAEPPAKKTDKKPPTTAPAKPVKDKPSGGDPPPKKDPPKKDPPKKDPPKKDPPKPDVVQKDPSKPQPRPGSNAFPRRALVISVHDYLYANPIHDGNKGRPDLHNLKTFLDKLSEGFKIPLNQIAHLSDEAAPKWGPRAPTKAVIEKTLTSFLDTCRPQDRVMVFLIAHAVELDDGVYVAPIEGELDNAATLIPLKWVYEQLGKCKARQKVLVFDGNRYNPTFGQERPGGEPMGEKLDALLKEPPAGVQVWSACVAKQRSYETDDSPMGVFLDEFYETLGRAMSKNLLGKIQKPEDPLPVEPYVAWVNESMKKELSRRNLAQESRLTGKAPEAGAAPDRGEAPAPEAVTCLAGAPTAVAQNKALIESVLTEVGTPAVKVTHEMPLRYDALPPFSEDALKKYADKPNPDSPVRKAVKKARAILWAVYPGAEPKELSSEIGPVRAGLRGVNLTVLRDGYRAPGGGNQADQLKARIEQDERAVARIMRPINDVLEELKSDAVTAALENEDRRWKANYNFVLARVQMEYAYLYEYQSALGSMRKEFPPRDPELHGGWKLASTPNLQGDSAGKKLAKDARKLLDKLAKDNTGTPWEVLAKREKLTNLGLEWQAAR